MLSPYKLTWRGMSSLEMDLLCELCFDGDSGSTETHLNRDAVVSESYSGTLRRVHGYKWNDVLTFSVTLIKKDYSDLTEQENRKILKWLTSSPNASFVDIYKDDSEVISWSSLGNWINISQYKLGNNRIVGYVAEWESVMPWALSPLKTITKDVSNPNDSTLTIRVSSDEPQSPIYPRITIQQDSITNIISINHTMTDMDDWIDGSVFYYDADDKYYWIDASGTKHESDVNDSGIDTTSVSITNKYTDGGRFTQAFNTVVKNNIKGETVVIDGANKVVASSRTDGRVFGDDFDWEWIPLYDGVNELSFVGNCTVTIEWREPIKCGEF